MPSYFSSSSAVSLILDLSVATILPAAPDILKLRGQNHFYEKKEEKECYVDTPLDQLIEKMDKS